MTIFPSTVAPRVSQCETLRTLMMHETLTLISFLQ